MHKNAYQGGEIRKSTEPPNDVIASFLVVVFCLIPIISIAVAIWRSA